MLRALFVCFFFLSLTSWCESEKCGGSCWARWGEGNKKEDDVWVTDRLDAPTLLPCGISPIFSSQWQTSNRRRGNKGVRTTAGRLCEGRVAILHTYSDRFLIWVYLGLSIRVGPEVWLYRDASSSPPPLPFIWDQGWRKDGPMTVTITQSNDKHHT